MRVRMLATDYVICKMKTGINFQQIVHDFECNIKRTNHFFLLPELFMEMYTTADIQHHPCISQITTITYRSGWPIIRIHIVIWIILKLL